MKALARPNIILAGLTTDICLFWAAVDAQKLGYRVQHGDIVRCEIDGIGAIENRAFAA